MSLVISERAFTITVVPATPVGDGYYSYTDERYGVQWSLCALHAALLTIEAAANAYELQFISIQTVKGVYDDSKTNQG